MRRTDLAMEARELWQERAGQAAELPGVQAEERERAGMPVTVVRVLDKTGERALGKPRGTYVTLEAAELDRRGPEAAELLGRELRALLNLGPGDRVLVVGLGNREITPDRIGPDTAGQILVTAHLKEQMPELFGEIRSVYALTPGVLGTTGLESAHLVAAAAERGAVSRIIAEEQEEEDAEGRGSREPDWGWAYCVSWLPWGLCTGRCWPVCSRKAQASVCWD